MSGDALGLTLKPMVTADIKRGKIGGRFDFGVTGISIGVTAGMTHPTIHWCRACGPWGCCCFSYPCGWGWGSESKREFDRLTVGGDRPGKTRNLLSSLGSAADDTPPVMGMVNISQIGVKHVAVNFAQFVEEVGTTAC